MTTSPPAAPIVPQLAAQMPAGEGVRSILRQLFAALEAQEQGTRAGLDPECLHDFRVAVRRTRSVLGQLKQALPEGAVVRFGPEFAWLGEITGPTRDLDVYLLRFPAYRDSLPPEDHDHLQPLHRFLLAHRQTAQAQLLKELDSERYQQLKWQWREFLDAPAGGAPLGGGGSRHYGTLPTSALSGPCVKSSNKAGPSTTLHRPQLCMSCAKAVKNCAICWSFFDRSTPEPSSVN